MWKVVPLSVGQRKDVRPQDIIENGMYRVCSTYRGGGGYDKFPQRAEERWGVSHHQQFIVQLFGCNLDCPYCYVTREGVWGKPTKKTSKELVHAFVKSNCDHGATVFHLMGGAPGLKMNKWHEIINRLDEDVHFDWVFHSDILLSERDYTFRTIEGISHDKALYAVDVKGLTHEEHLSNTRKPWNKSQFFNNLSIIEEAGVPFYFTFTNIQQRWRLWDWYEDNYPDKTFKRIRESSIIDLIDYEATANVDDVEWGGKNKWRYF